MKKYDVKLLARNELEKYLGILGVSADIKLGLFSDFGVNVTVDDPFFDDAIAISVKDKKGYIAGSNERSILIGVYRLLSEWGITFVRPGNDGTAYPEKCDAHDVDIAEKADKRHRVMCIEGAVSIENVLDMIEWMPKVGFNSYYIQFNVPHEFFERWYSHRGNDFKKAENHTTEKTMEYRDIMVRELKRRGLLVHTMGHGWTCFPFGVDGSGWDKLDSFPKEYEELCAIVGGERKVWKNIALYTQLCYSNPYVKSTIVKAVLDYVHNNPEADVVHFWLGDAYNNTCECEECLKGSYSDHYVRMGNEVTEILAKEGIKTKIGFVLGYNTSNPPILDRVCNEDNTLLVFAPICRNYFTSFPNEYKIKEIPEYEPNTFSTEQCNSVEKNLAYLHAWKKQYGGDCLDFDYHLMWDHILDAGAEGISRILSNDLKNLSGLGINGFISCQLQRNAFPTSLAMTVMAKTLWNEKADFEEIRRGLYKASFGEECVDMMCDYFSTLSEGFDIGELRRQKKFDASEMRTRVERAVSAMETFGGIIESHADEKDECRRKSWEYLEYHRRAYIPIGKQILAKLDGKDELAGEYWQKAVDYVMQNEDKLQPVLDTLYFRYMTKSRITVTKESEFSGI